MRRELRQRLLRSQFLAFATEALAPLGQAPAAHHRLLISHLQAVADGECDRLMVMMPPGSAKSTYATMLFPAWFMAARPGSALITASHTATLAQDFSRHTQRLVREHAGVLGYTTDTRAADLWYTSNGCRVLATGVGGAVTGSRADLALIDDPVKSRKDADSERLRDVAHNWYRADLLTRLRPGGRVVLIMTRWHEDDLAGRLLTDEPERWRILKLPARAEANDALGRSLGEPLWPAREAAAALDDKRSSLGEREWASLYQQSPRPFEGALFRTALLATLDAAPAGGRSVRAWDLAATRDIGTRDPDWTAGVKLTRMDDGRFVIEDVVRLRGSPDEVEATIVATASRDGRGVPIHLPQDPGQAGKAQVLYLTRKLPGHRVESKPVTGDKATRAAPLASQVNVGNVSLLRAGWNRALVGEMAGFPSAAHDDQVDAAALAFEALIAPPAPTRATRLGIMQR